MFVVPTNFFFIFAYIFHILLKTWLFHKNSLFSKISSFFFFLSKFLSFFQKFLIFLFINFLHFLKHVFFHKNTIIPKISDFFWHVFTCYQNLRHLIKMFSFFHKFFIFFRKRFFQKNSFFSKISDFSSYFSGIFVMSSKCFYFFYKFFICLQKQNFLKKYTFSKTSDYLWFHSSFVKIFTIVSKTFDFFRNYSCFHEVTATKTCTEWTFTGSKMIKIHPNVLQDAIIRVRRPFYHYNNNTLLFCELCKVCRSSSFR